MELRLLGQTGMAVSVIGLGTVTWGRLAGLGYRVPSTLPGDDRLLHLLDRAEELGVNLIDTAPAYGESEARLGALLAGRRERWRIASKAGEAFDGLQSHFDFSRPAVLASVGRSLRHLRTDRIDLLTVHSDGLDEGEAKFGQAIDALERLKRQGKIGAVGFSAKTEAGACWAAIRCDVVMLTWNETDQSLSLALQDARRHGAGVLAKKPLAQGKLPASALRFAVGTPGVASAILGTTDPLHLEAAVRALAGDQDTQAGIENPC